MNKFNLTYIIDDDPIFVMVLKKILSRMNYFDEIKNLKNGFEALTDLKKLTSGKDQFPDIIFLDLNMPVLDGWQFLEEVLNLPFYEKLNIYIISSTIDKREILKCKNYKSVKSFISKPTSENDLIRILELN